MNPPLNPIQAAQFRKRYADNPEKYKAENRAYRQRVKREVMTQYGGKCAVCGESELEFLVLDHINDDGGVHRKNGVSTGIVTYRWARDNGFPDTFQVLCHNHNDKKERKRVGRHQRAKWAAAIRAEAMAAYGGMCACCGEDDADTLQLDHVHGGGRAHRKLTGVTNFAIWAKRNGWPDMFQLMCGKCNFSRHIGGGTCLHHRVHNG